MSSKAAGALGETTRSETSVCKVGKLPGRASTQSPEDAVLWMTVIQMTVLPWATWMMKITFSWNMGRQCVMLRQLVASKERLCETMQNGFQTRIGRTAVNPQIARSVNALIL